MNMETDQGVLPNVISCRICRESVCPKKVTFGYGSDWSSLFEFCFGIQMTQNGPLSFCESCSNKLRDYGDFKRLCLQSEEIWKALMNFTPVKDTVKAEKIKRENSGYFDLLDYDDNDYNVILVVKEDDENLVKKLEDNLKEISVKKIDNTLIKDEDKKPKFTKVNKKTPIVSSKITKCKYRKKRGKKLKSLISSKNNQNAAEEQEGTGLFCGLCDFTTTSSVEMNEHLIRHCQENILTCQLCSFEGKDMAHMISHRYIHCPPQKGKNIECPMCPAKFYLDIKLQFHYRSVHLETKGGLCLFCERTYRSYKRWKYHERGHVSRNFICDHCGLSFVRRFEIKEHMAVHYDKCQFICHLCGKGFKRFNSLKSHHYYRHTEHKKVTCTICDSKFKHEECLKVHMRKWHKEKKFMCEVCSKSFCTNQMLRKHMFYNHSDEKPYACDLCGARFRANLNRKVHMRLHTGELPYTCRECGKGFTSSSGCTRHQSVHTGVRPVKCLHCDKTFGSKKIMQAHCNSKHKDALGKDEVKLSLD